MKHFILLILLLSVPVVLCDPNMTWAQEERKGDLEDFEDDYDDDDDSDDDEEEEWEDDDNDGQSFFVQACFQLMVEGFSRFFSLWGGTPGTAFGPYPSFPYKENEGFMSTDEAFRSYFFNTEFTYHYLTGNLRSLLFKWETQFVDKSKLSFDLSVYRETITSANGSRTDHLTIYGLRYGYAIFRSPKMILNLEGGLRGLGSHGGYELGLDLQLFPKKPLIIETEAVAGLIEGEPLYIVESSAGVILGRFEFLGGMRILKNQSGDLLDGFRVGVRIWY